MSKVFVPWFGKFITQDFQEKNVKRSKYVQKTGNLIHKNGDLDYEGAIKGYISFKAS